MQTKYHLLSITALVCITYLLSYLGTKTGIYKLKDHSKFWNTILLICFLVAGSLGFFLVIQINFKIEISFIELIMLLHVDVGIALFLVSLFHILLHWSYFMQLLSRSRQSPHLTPPLPDKIRNERQVFLPQSGKLILSIFLSGITSIIMQILIVREFISVFSGNELITGILLFNWLVINGAGAYLAKMTNKIRKSVNLIMVLHLLLAILPLLTVFILFSSKNLAFPAGIQVNYVALIFFSFFLLLPFCLISGFMFSILGHFLSARKTEQKIYLNYSFESMGSLFGGLIFSFILVFYANTIQTLAILCSINILAIYLYWSGAKPMAKIPGIFIPALVILFAGFYFNTDKQAKSLLFPGHTVVEILQSPYGQTIVTRDEGQLNFYRDGIFMLALDSSVSVNSNIAADEETVHFAMLQHPVPEKVLLISGGLGGKLAEILKYPVKSIDYVEIDPLLSDLALKYNPLLKHPAIRIINQDARDFISSSGSKYDIVLLCTPPPSSTETGRFYTTEFFNSLKKRMEPDSYLILTLPSTVNYIDTLSLRVNKLVYNTLADNFSQVRILPGEQNYFIASDKGIKTNIVELSRKREIENEYIGYYLDDVSIATRSETMMNRIGNDQNGEVNKDLKPLSHSMFIHQQWSIFSGSYRILLVFVFILLIFIFRRFNSVRFAVFSAGFASISSELVIIYLFQMMFGTAYYYMGIIFTVFMAGLAIGPLIPHRRGLGSMAGRLIFTLILLGMITLIFPLALKFLSHIHAGKYLVYFSFFVLTFFIGMVTSYTFKLSTFLLNKSALQIAGDVYSADLYGSSLGALLTSLLVLPLTGILFSGLPGFLLCMIAVLLLKITGKQGRALDD